MRTGFRGALAAIILISILMSFLVAIPKTARAATVTVTVLAPVGGEVWSAGSAHDVRWTMTTDSGNPTLSVDLDYLVGGGPTAILTGWAYPVDSPNGYAWTVPAADLANVTVRVCATDIATGSACATSNAFDVDGIGPAVTFSTPIGGNADLFAPIEFTLSESVDIAKLRSAFSVSPDPGGLLLTKASNLGFATTHLPFDNGTTYTVTIGCAATDGSDPGNPLENCPVSWTFTTDTPPAIGLASPVGGVDWTGGSVHAIRWTATDAEDPIGALDVYLESSLDGVSWASITGPLPASDGAYAWTVPLVDVSVARVRAHVFDTRGMNVTATTAAFAIDSTPPNVIGVTPPDGATDVGWSTPVLVTFDEPVLGPADATTFGLRTAAGEWTRGTATWLSPQELRFTPSSSYRAAATYFAVLNATLLDRSEPGNRIAPYAWTFATRPNNAPSITITSSFPPVLSGGAWWTLSWTATDPDDAAALLSASVEFSDGGPFTTVAGPLPSQSSFLWSAPTRDLAAATLRVRVVDSQGGAASASVTFAVDATSPTITAKDPSPDAFDVTPNATITVRFSEPLNASIGFVALRDAATRAWVPVATRWDDAQTLRLMPANLLREGAVYEVVVNGTAVDRSDPGNPLAASSWRFRVAAYPPFVAVVAPAPGVRWTAGVPQSMRVWAMDGQDASVTVTADVSLDGITFTPVLAATPMGNGESTFLVTPPNANGVGAILRICATDSADATACTSVAIDLDATPPRVTQTAPAGGARRILPNAPLTLRFSEPVVPATVEAAFSLEPETNLTFRWARTYADNDTVFVDHAPLLELRTYTATLACGVRDASLPGLAMPACPVTFAFTIAAAPQIELLFPLGGERLTGGAEQTIRWTTAAEEPSLRATVELSTDGGATFPVRLADAVLVSRGGVALPRTFPASDGAAVLRVTVSDSLGLTAIAASAPFVVDADPPRIVSSSVGDGTVFASPRQDLVLVFSEGIDPQSVLDVLGTAGLSAGVTFGSTNVPLDTVRIVHTFRYGESLTLPLVRVRDLSRPGNPGSGVFGFSVLPDTERPRVTLALEADATEGSLVVLDASASTDNDAIVHVNWTITDPNGVSVARYQGMRVEWRAGSTGGFTVTAEAVDRSGNVGTATAPLHVHTLGGVETQLPPSIAVTFLGWLALAGTGASSSYGFTDRGRAFLSRTFLLPLYVKVKGPAVLNQETRGMIRGYILVNPGDCYTDIKRNLGLANGEVAYHLKVLEREGIVHAASRGARRMYYPAEMPLPDNGGLHEVQERMMKHLCEMPGTSVKDLARLLGISAQLAMYHVRRLYGSGLVRYERHGVRFLVFPTSDDERRLHDAETQDT